VLPAAPKKIHAFSEKARLAEVKGEQITGEEGGGPPTFWLATLALGDRP
jgi:hypothetical protein